MKKILCVLLAALTILSLCACGSADTAPASTTAAVPAETTETTVSTEPASSEVYHNTKWDGKTMKVLCVGNSFARNGSKYLYEIATAHGVEEVVVGVLYIGGCSVSKHWSNAKSNAAAYTYYKNDSGQWKKIENASLIYGLQDEDWDVITITQGQGNHGIPSSYDGCLEELVAYLQENKTNPEAQLAFHMTWAFPPNSTNDRFNLYANNQETMFQAITQTARDRVLPVAGIDLLLPDGTSIQNARTKLGEIFFDDDLFHLNSTGEFVASYTWFAYLTGQPVEELKYLEPIQTAKSSHEPILKAVNAALASPFTVTDVSE